MTEDQKRDAMLIELQKRLTAERKLIAAGWVGLQLVAVPPDAPPIQIEEMRNAFFAGALHLFRSLMSILDPGDEATDADLKRMDDISAELDIFEAEYRKKHGLRREH